MRDPKRIDEILRLLKQVWVECPDFRFGQMVYNAVNSPFTSFEDYHDFLFHVEDNKTIEYLEDFLARYCQQETHKEEWVVK